MPAHLHRETDLLKKHIMALGTLVEENLRRAVDAAERMDAAAARDAVNMDAQIDRREVEIEEECLKALALYQPVAQDLRFIVGVLKLNNDLERIGDMAVNIAEKVLILAEQDVPDISFGFAIMAERVRYMLRAVLDAFVAMDATAARRVCAMDDEVDDLNRTSYGLAKDGIRRNVESVDPMINLLAISRNLERVADHATNIAEDIIYMVEGDIVRHRKNGRQ